MALTLTKKVGEIAVDLEESFQNREVTCDSDA